MAFCRGETHDAEGLSALSCGMEQEEDTGTDTAYAQSTAREQAKGAERKRLRHPRYAGECIKPPGITGTTESRA